MSGGSGGVNGVGGAAGGTTAAGTNSGGASSAGSSSAGAPSAGAGGTAATGASGCAYSVSGGLKDPTTDAPYGCTNSHIEQTNGQGDYTASIGAGFQDAAGNQLALACTISSAKAPSAGDTWTISTDTHSQGNCQVQGVKGSTPALWAASSNDAGVTGSASISFKSATKTKGMYHPENVYYFFEVTLTTTVKGLSAGDEDVTVTGSFANKSLPLGS